MINVFKLLEAICDEYQIHSLQQLLNAIRKILDQQNFINVSVLGQFKTGKSSFINSLLNKSLLPTGNIPVTNVVTSVQYGENEKVTIHKLNKQSVKINPNEIEDYVSENKNPDNVKEIKSATIESPELKQIDKLKIIDTPGLGSIYGHNTRTTSNWLPHIGCSIILISSSQPLSENDIRLIEETMNYCPEIIILITKADLLDNSEIEKIKQFIDSSLRKKFNKNFRKYIYSVKIDTYRDRILKDLLIPLNQNIENNYKNILIFKLISLRNQCLNYLNIVYHSILKKKEGKNLLKEKILDEKLNKDLINNELNLIEQSYISQTRNKIKNYLFEKYQSELTNKIISSFYHYYFSWDGNLYTLARNYEFWCKDVISKELLSILDKEKEKFDEILSEPKHHFEQYMKSFRERLNENIFKVLSVRMKTEIWKMNTKKTDKPDVSISWAFDSHIDMLWFLFPMVFFKKIFFKYFKKQIPYEVEKNLHRLTSELTENINSEIMNMKQKTIHYITDELEMIEKLLTAKNNNEDSVKKSINILENLHINGD